LGDRFPRESNVYGFGEKLGRHAITCHGGPDHLHFDLGNIRLLLHSDVYGAFDRLNHTFDFPGQRS